MRNKVKTNMHTNILLEIKNWNSCKLKIGKGVNIFLNLQINRQMWKNVPLRNEGILILVVLIGLVLIFKDQLTYLVYVIFDGIFEQAGDVW